MKQKYIITKTITQILIYLLEILIFAGFLTYITTLITKIKSGFELVERFTICYTLYQILVVIILTNINDIQKDSCLAYIRILKKLLLYFEVNSKILKQEILKNIDYQLDSGTFNNPQYRNSYEKIKTNITEKKSFDKDMIKNELINAEHRYEMISLNWRFSFLLRIFK